MTNAVDTQNEARRDVIHYIELEYNSNRSHSTLGNLTRREKEWPLLCE